MANGAGMRALFVLITFLFGSIANAQQCPQCAAADACIKDYTRAISKIKSDNRKGTAAQRKGREQSLSERFLPRSAVADRDSFDQAIHAKIDRLRDCLSKTQ